MRKRGIVKAVIINLTILGSLLMVVELVFGAWVFHSNELNFFGVPADMDEQFKIDLYTETPITVQHTRDQYGLRGQSSFGRPEKIDILAIGGSTTFQKYIADKDTWEARLQEKFKATGKEMIIANAGINGHSTHAHIKAFNLWLSKIEDLNPRYILFYIGINDYLPRPFLMPQKGPVNPLKKALQDKSVIYNTLRRAKGAYLARKTKFETNKVDFGKYEFTEASLLTEAYREFYLNEYVPAFEQRVKRLIELSKAMGAEPIFITQPMALYQFKEGKLYGVSDPRNDLVTGQPLTGLDAYELITYLNEAMREICHEKYQVIELTGLPVWEQTDYHDWFHNTPQGTKKVADEIWKQLGNYID